MVKGFQPLAGMDPSLPHPGMERWPSDVVRIDGRRGERNNLAVLRTVADPNPSKGHALPTRCYRYLALALVVLGGPFPMGVRPAEDPREWVAADELKRQGYSNTRIPALSP